MNYDVKPNPLSSTEYPAGFRFPELKIGSIPIGFPCIQAALSGVSDWAERQIARRHGASATISEVMLDEFIVSVTRGKKARRFLRCEEDDHPVGAQLMGVAPEEFTAAARRVLDELLSFPSRRRLHGKAWTRSLSILLATSISRPRWNGRLRCWT